jgi:UDP-perosamine 4-acetyltransferase
MREQLIIFGSGGHAKVVIDAVEQEGKYEIAFLSDADPNRIGKQVLGYSIRAEKDGFAARSFSIARAFVAIGDNASRQKIAMAARQYGLTLATIIHPSAVVARTAYVGAGTLVMPGAVINADAFVGDNVIVNSGAVIEHDCNVGEGAHIAPNATLCGGVQVGAGSLIGAGATVLIGIHVGTSVIIGAGSTVLTDIPDHAYAVGSPSRINERIA